MEHPHTATRRVSAAVVGFGLVLTSLFALFLTTEHGHGGQLTMITPTPAEQAQWRAATATPAQRAEVVADLRSAFAGIADVGTGDLPTPAAVQSAVHPIAGTANDVLAYGVTGNHVWIIASYADIADQAVNGAVKFCTTRLPGWLCNDAGASLKSWANGWGRVSNHGVWAAIYYGSPWVQGGRW